MILGEIDFLLSTSQFKTLSRCQEAAAAERRYTVRPQDAQYMWALGAVCVMTITIFF